MKNSLCCTKVFSTVSLVVLAVLTLLVTQQAQAATSPYVTEQANVPLNQSTNDSINGLLPYFNSHSPIEGAIGSLIDATAPDAPTDNVILGPDNTWVGVAWDFGDPGAGYMWQLHRVDAWISAGDNLRKGYRADLSVSTTGDVNDFTVITNTFHEEVFTQNSQYNYIRYDFPNEFIAGPDAGKHRYPVKGFRYLRLNSRGDTVNGTDWQTRFVEVDVWVTKIGTPPSIISVARNNSGDVDLVWTAVSGATYAVEYKSDLTAATWSNLQNVVAEGETATVVDPGTSGSQRFYRVVLQP